MEHLCSNLAGEKCFLQHIVAVKLTFIFCLHKGNAAEVHLLISATMVHIIHSTLDLTRDQIWSRNLETISRDLFIHSVSAAVVALTHG